MHSKSINCLLKRLLSYVQGVKESRWLPFPVLSSGNYRDVDILPGDTVILAAAPIPGNEKNVSRIIDNLFQLGAKVIYGSGSITGMHVSGHGYQEDLKLMLTLMKPKYFIPIHGEYRMLHHHRLLAESVGVEEGNTFIIKNGDVVDIDKSG